MMDGSICISDPVNPVFWLIQWYKSFDPGLDSPALCPFTFGSLSSFGQVQCVKISVHLSILLPWNRRDKCVPGVGGTHIPLLLRAQREVSTVTLWHSVLFTE